MNLKKYFEYARNLLKTKPKQSLMEAFHNLSSSLKEQIVYDENYSKKFFKSNKSLFENEPDIKSIQERFESFFWDTQKEYEIKLMSKLFDLRESFGLLPDSERKWFIELYIEYESEVFKYLNDLYQKYTEDLKQEYLEYLVTKSIENYVGGGFHASFDEDDDEDDDDEQPTTRKKRYQ